MKFLGATVLVILCTRVLYSYEEESKHIQLPCCMTYVTRQIPRKFVVAYFETSSQCPQNAVVFLTKRGRHICANPSNAWVQEYINNLKETPQAVQ
ncbi:C-C motif chemokine 18-like isoform X2 [Myotis daubentonii]|uniref:C-C motif chemokine 18-like isoform X2 n=1 Tax=Myotis daubentonii TaxID=98922 RepID=UPI002873BBCF|nr:C-C motif chemokine 18-like isoform X2 [Myotis daubentonii]